MLELMGVEKKYGAVHALQRTDLTIRDGEFFSLLGPSGCGKTTLLRMLGGFESPTSGQIVHNGKRIDNLPANQRQFNMVFQRYALFPHLSVWENVAFGLRMKKVPEPEVRSRVAEMLSLVKLEGMDSREVTTLSGGQQQRVALARALVNRPKVLLLDEPLEGLAPVVVDLLLRALERLIKEDSLAMILVEQSARLALEVTRDAIVLNRGRIAYSGPSKALQDDPEQLARLVAVH
jgi:spermidine/putrescine transport system ATP-binding protein